MKLFNSHCILLLLVIVAFAIVVEAKSHRRAPTDNYSHEEDLDDLRKPFRKSKSSFKQFSEDSDEEHAIHGSSLRKSKSSLKNSLEDSDEAGPSHRSSLIKSKSILKNSFEDSDEAGPIHGSSLRKSKSRLKKSVEDSDEAGPNHRSSLRKSKSSLKNSLEDSDEAGPIHRSSLRKSKSILKNSFEDSDEADPIHRSSLRKSKSRLKKSVQDSDEAGPIHRSSLRKSKSILKNSFEDSDEADPIHRSSLGKSKSSSKRSLEDSDEAPIHRQSLSKSKSILKKSLEDSDEAPIHRSLKKQRKNAYQDSYEDHDDDDDDEEDGSSIRSHRKKFSSKDLRKWANNVPVSPGESFCEGDCGKAHIGCKYSFYKPEPACAERTDYNDLNEYKDYIVKVHNKIRNLVAGGNLDTLKPAIRMASMQWDHSLHLTATYKAKLCSLQSENCHGTQKFPFSGQNIAMFSYSGLKDKYSLDYIIRNRLEDWFGEHVNCTRTIIKKFPVPENKVGLFTIMVSEDNDYVGCGLNRYEDGKMHRVMFVCHYATNNFIGYPVYTTGEVAGSACKTGINNDYANLCSTHEKYDHSN